MVPIADLENPKRGKTINQAAARMQIYEDEDEEQIDTKAKQNKDRVAKAAASSDAEA
jgi:hypothetical protein